MKITNVTHWQTVSLKRLILRVAQDELDNGQLKHATITIKYRRSGSGKMGECCTIGTPRNPWVVMTLMLPRIGPIDVRSYALIIAHEFAHARGMQHRDMKSNRYGWSAGWEERYAYALDYSIEAKPITSTSKEDRIALRRQAAVTHAQKKVTEWEQAAKRADTHTKKWSARLKAAQKRATLPLSHSTQSLSLVPQALQPTPLSQAASSAS